MTSQLEKEVAHYQEWRDQMISGIESYKSWLDTNGYADIQQSLRIYDLNSPGDTHGLLLAGKR